MLLGVAGKAIHPGLLIHDSPGEADLGTADLPIASRLRCRASRTVRGSELAPFQYLLTTTNAPPVGVRSYAVVCLKLSGEWKQDLLFREGWASRLLTIRAC